MTEKKRGALYLRVSTSHQDYEMQRRQLTSLFEAKGIEIVKIFEEKMTGTDDDRPEFQNLLKLTRDDVDYIGVWALDRLSRKMSTIVKTIEMFNEKSICLLEIKNNFQSLNNDFKVSDSTMIMLGVLSSVAQIERTNLIERTREGRKNKILEGKLPYTPKPPIGYKVENKQVVIDEDKAQIVRHIYKDYLDGWGMTSLSRAYGIYISDIKKILHNETYTGRARTKLVEGRVFEIPQIIDDETYRKVQDMIIQRRNQSGRKGRHNPLARKVKCGCCGHSITNYTDPKNGYTYYRCNRPCQKVNIQEATIRNLIRSVMNRHIREYRKNNKDKKVTKGKIKEIQRQILHMNKIVENETAQMQELNEKIEILKTRMTIDKLKKEISGLKKIQESIKAHQKEAMRLRDERKYYEKILKSLDEEVELSEDKIIEEHLTDMILYRLKENRYKYFRIVIDGLYKYEGVVHSSNCNKVIHPCKEGEGYMFYVDNDILYWQGTDIPLDYKEQMGIDE